MGHLGGWGTWVIGTWAEGTCEHVLDHVQWDTWPMGHMGNGVHGYNLGHMGNSKNGQRGIIINTADRDGTPWGMGHMGDGAHGQWGTWA